MQRTKALLFGRIKGFLTEMQDFMTEWQKIGFLDIWEGKTAFGSLDMAFRLDRGYNHFDGKRKGSCFSVNNHKKWGSPK